MSPVQPAPAGKIPFVETASHFGPVSPAAPSHSTQTSLGGARTLGSQLRYECDAMARHALRHGLSVAPDLIARLAALLAQHDGNDAVGQGLDGRTRELAAIHSKLTQIVAPATPQGILLLEVHRHGTLRAALLGPVPLIRMLTLIALGFLVAVVASALSAEVSGENLGRGMLASSGSTLLLNMMFLMCCAGLGASFATLFHAHRYIENSTYDPKFDASYSARLILGLIAGLILVEMLPAQLFTGGDASGFGKPALAMLGGFSASAVHRLLQRLVDALETVVRGDPASKLQAALASQRAHAASERLQAQGDVAQRLFALQQTLDGSASLDTVRQQLADITRTVLTGDAGSLGQGNNGAITSHLTASDASGPPSAR